MGCYAVLQGIFLTQGLNPCLLDCKQCPALQVDSLPADPPGKPTFVCVCVCIKLRASQVALVVKNPPVNARELRDMGSISGWGRSLGRGHGNPLQCSFLENPMDRRVCWATAYGVPKSRTQLKQLGTHVYNWVYTVHLKLAQLYKSTVFQAWTMIRQILRKRTRRTARTTSHVMLNLPLLWLCIEGIVCPVYLSCFNVMCMLSPFSRVPLSVTPWTVAHQILLSLGFFCPWDSPGKNTWVGCHLFLQGDLPSPGSNPGLLLWQVDSLPQGPPKVI